MIRFDSVTKYFPTPIGRHFVLNNATFEIPDLARVGVLGKNGAGKSTMMRLFAGVDAPSAGKITRTGSISWPMGIANSMHKALTGRENARFACRIQGLSRFEIDEVVESIYEFAEIGKFFDMRMNTYSSGMRARLNFAIAMAFSFDCYIIDELTAVGDLAFRQKSAEVFKQKRDAASFIKVSHNFKELKAECDSGLVLLDGKAILFPTIEEAIAVYEADVRANQIARGLPIQKTKEELKEERREKKRATKKAEHKKAVEARRREKAAAKAKLEKLQIAQNLPETPPAVAKPPRKNIKKAPPLKRAVKKTTPRDKKAGDNKGADAVKTAKNGSQENSS